MKHEIPFECGEHHKDAALDRVTWKDEDRQSAGFGIGAAASYLSRDNYGKLNMNGLLAFNNRRGPMIRRDELEDCFDAIESALYLLGVEVKGKPGRTPAYGGPNSPPEFRFRGLYPYSKKTNADEWIAVGERELAVLHWMVERRMCKIYKPKRQRLIRKGRFLDEGKMADGYSRSWMEKITRDSEGRNSDTAQADGDEGLLFVNHRVSKSRFRDALMALDFERLLRLQ